ncbi:hypothetical protein AAES_18990 [Amazona aestiva]|uniref:Uncharacterized protein n=1 Tax=Amazona aestiva TaxID=12930 RepID=A0A0Q3U0Q9_AMAAE|nr:hypothetical protein AAES_18990 [Amazona aestiva]
MKPHSRQSGSCWTAPVLLGEAKLESRDWTDSEQEHGSLKAKKELLLGTGDMGTNIFCTCSADFPKGGIRQGRSLQLSNSWHFCGESPVVHLVPVSSAQGESAKVLELRQLGRGSKERCHTASSLGFSCRWDSLGNGVVLPCSSSAQEQALLSPLEAGEPWPPPRSERAIISCCRLPPVTPAASAASGSFSDLAVGSKSSGKRQLLTAAAQLRLNPTHGIRVEWTETIPTQLAASCHNNEELRQHERVASPLVHGTEKGAVTLLHSVADMIKGALKVPKIHFFLGNVLQAPLPAMLLTNLPMVQERHCMEEHGLGEQISLVEASGFRVAPSFTSPRSQQLLLSGHSYWLECCPSGKSMKARERGGSKAEEVATEEPALTFVTPAEIGSS